MLELLTKHFEVHCNAIFISRNSLQIIEMERGRGRKERETERDKGVRWFQGRNRVRDILESSRREDAKKDKKKTEIRGSGFNFEQFWGCQVLLLI